jgi:hypothetical protein
LLFYPKTVNGDFQFYLVLITKIVMIKTPILEQLPLRRSSDAVPEPTSAMLLLLGMAGLALKRKRA